MKKSQMTFAIATMLAWAACNQPSTPTETPAVTKDTVAVMTESQNAAPMDSAAMMKAWMEFATPGEMHALIAKFDGEWNEELTMWMTPDAPPSKNTATVVSKMIFGGRYQESRHTGTFDGMPFEGINILGYDNFKKKLFSTWMDNMGTGIMIMEGTWDDATKTMNFAGRQIDPITGVDTEMRETVTIIDDNTQTMEMFIKPAGGEEFKTMEIKLSRKI